MDLTLDSFSRYCFEKLKLERRLGESSFLYWIGLLLIAPYLSGLDLVYVFYVRKTYCFGGSRILLRSMVRFHCLMSEY